MPINESKPLISVIMPVYNSEKYVKNAINSILQQSFKNFELIVIDDGSTDSSVEVIRKIKDERISFISHIENKGNYRRRNEGINLSKGKYISVMDSDDEALPFRLEMQVSLLERNQNLLGVGSQFEMMGRGISKNPQEYELLKILLLNNNMFLHPSLLIRKNILEQVNGYNEKYYYASDYDLACRLAIIGKIINMPDILMRYRVHSPQISTFYRQEQKKYADLIRINYLDLLGFKLTVDDKLLFNTIMNREKTMCTSNEVLFLLSKIIKQNKVLKILNPNYLSSFFNFLMIKYV